MQNQTVNYPPMMTSDMRYEDMPLLIAYSKRHNETFSVYSK